jgi:hypothetical protein
MRAEHLNGTVMLIFSIASGAFAPFKAPTGSSSAGCIAGILRFPPMSPITHLGLVVSMARWEVWPASTLLDAGHVFGLRLTGTGLSSVLMKPSNHCWLSEERVPLLSARCSERAAVRCVCLQWLEAPAIHQQFTPRCQAGLPQGPRKAPPRSLRSTAARRRTRVYHTPVEVLRAHGWGLGGLGLRRAVSGACLPYEKLTHLAQFTA